MVVEVEKGNFMPEFLRPTRLFDNLQDKINYAISLLRENEPPEGYYLAFSGGKDSCVIKQLAIEAGVKFDAWYNCTTIDPPELIYFMREHHQDVKWNRQKVGMMKLLETKSDGPPTRWSRWCCQIYKEQGGVKRDTILGVRAAESAKRKLQWKEIQPNFNNNLETAIICPIIYWKDEDVWDFIRSRNIPYCKLYDLGWKRLGCIGCPMSGKGRKRDFEKWPGYERNWKRAIAKNWENFHDKLNKRGLPRYQNRYKSAEDFWDWWMEKK